jgi:hypothetical protein
MGRLWEKLARDKIEIVPGAGFHTLRHTFLTEAGGHKDVFTLQYIAGYDTIKTTTRFVDPRVESLSRTFGSSESETEPPVRKAIAITADAFVAKSAKKRMY